MSRINTNVSSLIAQRVLKKNNNSLNTSLERLSTGLRINSGADDPAGLIASQNLDAEKTGLTVWLKVSFAKLAARVKIDGTRPKFTSKEEAETLHQSREPYYAMAKLHISTDHGTPDTVVDEILGAIRAS